MDITLDVLSDLRACQPAKAAFVEVFGEAEVPWLEVVAHPKCNESWALWLKGQVAKFGSAEDLGVLRFDNEAYIRGLVARYGSDEDREALRSDESWTVRYEVYERDKKAKKR
jgi:hypothetical protein